MRFPVFCALSRAAFAGAAVLCCLSLATSVAASGQRLPETVQPEHYTLTLTPDLKAATFSGVETIDVGYVQLRLIARTLPGRQFEVAREIRLRASNALRAADIASPGSGDPASRPTA